MPGIPESERRAGRRRRETALDIGRARPEDRGEARGDGRRVGHLVDGRDQGGAAPARREVRDAGQVERPDDLPVIHVDRGQPIGRGRDDLRPAVDDQQVIDRVVDLGERGRLESGADPAVADEAQVERREAAVVVADDQPLVGVVDRQRGRSRRLDDRDELARLEVVGPDLGPGRDVEALPGADVRGCAAARRRDLVDPARLDRGRHDGHLEIARGGHVVLAPEHDPGRHQVLGEVRVGPLVDVVRQAVAPVLEELRRGPCVIDLVEVHLERLVEPEGAQHHRPEDEHDDDPQVEPVEPAAALVTDRGRPVGPDPRVVVAGLEPGDDADVVEGAAGGPARHRRGRRGGWDRRAPRCDRPRSLSSRATSMAGGLAAVGRRRRPAPPPARPRPRRPMVSAEASSSSSASRALALGRSWANAHRKTTPLTTARIATGQLGPERRSDAEPVGDPRVVVERVGQRRVHVEEDRHRQAPGRAPRQRQAIAARMTARAMAGYA